MLEGHTTSSGHGDTCFVIWSQAKNKEILDITLDSWLKVADALGLKIYVVTDDVTLNHRKIVYKKDCWQGEWNDALVQLKDKGYLNIISVLDDFFLTSLPGSLDEIKAVLETYYSNGWKYLSLVPHPNAICTFGYKELKIVDGYSKLDQSWKYRNSLQVSVWNVEHMIELVEQSKNIWFFEDTVSRVESYYSVGKRLLKYRHIVEKGLLNYNSLIYTPIKAVSLLKKKKMSFNYRQLPLIPKIIASNIFIKLFGLRLHEK